MKRPFATRAQLCPVLLALAGVAGCANVPPAHVTSDRLGYGQVLAESWKRQTLQNVVRLRYADAPMFLDVGSVINSRTQGSTATARATLPSSIDPNVLEFGGTGNWSNTPTITYQPLIGDRFTRALLQPVPPVAVFQLLQGGWPATLVFQTMVGSVNGLRNSSAGVASDPRFDELSTRLTRIQRAGNVGIRVEARKDRTAVVAVMRRTQSTNGENDDSRRVRELLGLAEGTSEFEITYGLAPTNPNEVAMVTRSMMEIMLHMGFGVEIPADHVTSGRALAGQRGADEEVAKPLVRIRSGREEPLDAYAAVSYKGYWYWIDDTDIAAKSTFTFLMILFSLAETGQSAGAPVVTVPSR